MTATPQTPDPETSALMSEIEEIERALLADPSDVEMLLRAARWGERTGRYDEARRFYMHAVNAAPTRPEPLVGLTDLLRGQSLHAEAIQLLQMALERMPDQADLWCAIARVMTDLGTNDKAELFLNEALRLEPGNVTARLQRGALRRAGRNAGPAA
jgi:cytochrome c-type biogenesis protein CcmH/NrfG